MIQSGLDVFVSNSDPYRKRKVALIANQTSVTSDLRYGWDQCKDKGLDLVRIFSPEHGLFAVEQDQIAVRMEPELGCEVVSLYGTSAQSLIPDPALLSDIDLVLFDIQDVGSRYYTYLNTMALFMKAISGSDIEFMVLDRPNPLAGITVEGPMLDPAYQSFVGVFDVPVRHGLTAGELARFYQAGRHLDLNLTVIKMRGWQRSMRYCETGLPWVPPSPNMPTEATADVYPGMCLLEGTNLSEGRGTAMPFLTLGAPFIEGRSYARALAALNLAGVTFRPVFFKPTFNKYANQINQGVFIHVTQPHLFAPFKTGVAVIKTAFDMYENDFAFLRGVYEFDDRYPAFDLLTGSGAIREMIGDGRNLREICQSWQSTEDIFEEERQPYFLY